MTKRVWTILCVSLACIAGACVLPGAAAAAACPGGSDIWQGGSGQWNTAGDWSAGVVPDHTTVACLPGSGTPYTVTLSSSSTSTTNATGNAAGIQIGSGATLELNANGGNTVQLDVSDRRTTPTYPGATNNGTIELANDGATGSQSLFTVENSDVGATLTNNGAILSEATVPDNWANQLEAVVENASTGTIHAESGNLLFSSNGGQSSHTTDHNSGVITVDSGADIAVQSGGGCFCHDFDMDAGTLTNNGTFEVDHDTFTATGGTITGTNSVSFPLGGTLNADGTGTGAFTEGPGNSLAITSDIASGYTVSVPNGGEIDANGSGGLGLTNHGTISIESTGQNGNQGILGGGQVTNDGTLSAGATGTSPWLPDLRPAISNAATMNITGQGAQTDALLSQSAGTLTVHPGAALNSARITVSGGTLADDGQTYVSTAITATGGAISSHPLQLNGGSLTLSGSGSGAISTYGATLDSDIPSGYVVTVNADLKVVGSSNSGATNHGTVVMVGDSTPNNPNIYNNPLTNAGTLTVTAGPTPPQYRVVNSALTNTGTMNVEASVGVTSGMTTSGTVTVGPNSTLSSPGSGSYSQSAGATDLKTSTSQLTGFSTVTLNGGSLSGAGTVAAPVTNAGTVHPGNSPGVLTITGSYTQQPAGTLAIDVAGSSPGSGYSQLDVSGAATLAGRLAAKTSGAHSGKFRVVQAGSLSGNFTTASFTGEHYKVGYDSTGVTLTGIPAPVNTKAPTISGPARAGDALIGHPGSWKNSPRSFAYRWLRCNKTGDKCVKISGAHGRTYHVQAADVGHTIRLVVMASNGLGSRPATSAPTPVVRQ